MVHDGIITHKGQVKVHVSNSSTLLYLEIFFFLDQQFQHGLE